MITLKAGEVRPFPLAGRFLVCRFAQAGFYISAPDKGVQETPLQTSDTAILDGINTINLINKNATDLQIDIQSSRFKIESNSGGAVTINGGEIDRIKEAINVNATSTVENGSMKLINANQYQPIVNKTIPANSAVLIVAARAVKSRKVTLQSIGTLGLTKLRIGNDGTIDGTKGLLLQGDIDAPASAEINNESAVYIYNDSAVDAVVCGVEEWTV